MKKLLKIIPILFLTTLFLQSCDNDDDTVILPVTNNIVDIAQSSEEFTSLVAALQKANLVTTLQTQGPFTVLAPTNAAFSTFSSSLLLQDCNVVNEIKKIGIILNKFFIDVFFKLCLTKLA